MNTTKFTNDLLTNQLNKLVNDSIKPMSIIEIKEKFNLSFPFKVKRVKQSLAGVDGRPNIEIFKGITTIGSIGLIKNLTEQCLCTNNVEKLDRIMHQSAEVQDYILFEEN